MGRKKPHSLNYPSTRRRPVKHTVHTKNPRYTVPSYPRGSRQPTSTKRNVTEKHLSEQVNYNPVRSFAQHQLMKRNLRSIQQNAKISPDLKFAVSETIKALDRGDTRLAYELTSVKSYVSGVSGDPKENHFREDTEYNEKKLGQSVYGILDGLHHELAMIVDEIPSGMVVITAEGMSSGGRVTRKHPTISLIQKENQVIQKRANRLNALREKGYSYGHRFDTPQEAEENANTLRKSHYGVRKRKVYSGVTIVPELGGFSVYSRASKGYHNWLKTGK